MRPKAQRIEAPGSGTPALHEADLELARNAIANEAGARGEFASRLRPIPRILAVINIRAGRPLDEHELADLAQDTLLLIWRKLAHYNGASALLTWAYGVARFEFMNGMRRRRRAGHSLDELDPGSNSIAGEEVHAPDGDPGELYLFVDELGPPDTQIVRGKHVDDLTFEELAQRLGLPANTIKTRYYRSLARLARRLGGTHEGEHER